MIKYLLTAVFITIAFISCTNKSVSSASNQKLDIDSTIRKKVLAADSSIDSSQLSRVSVKYFENDKEQHVSMFTGEKAPYHVYRFIHGDSVSYYFGHLLGGGFGLFVFLTPDKMEGKQILKVKDGSKIYRQSPGAPYSDSISVAGDLHLILDKRKPDSDSVPSYGWFEYKGKDYYKKTDSGDIKSRLELSGYFRTKDWH